MAVAISRVTPAVIHRLQIPVQVLLYAGLFVLAQYLVSSAASAASCQPGRDGADAGVNCLPGYPAELDSRRCSLVTG